ncbi:MAG: hypothetical protein HYV20_04845 [Gemmatimonadetes bacterium]|nr:hypothetical protein [Gemmatimonadota bacterium]
MRHAGKVFIPLWLLLAACGGEPPEGGEAARAPDSGMAGMAMPSMRMPSMDSLPAVRAYLDSVVRAEPGELAAMVAGHRARIDRMLAAMDQDMTAMNMTPDAAWQALADSVRADMVAIPGLGGEGLVLQMRGHAGRMRRLLERHKAMMRM